MTIWTAKAVEYRVLEAAETLMLLPNHRGGGSIAWPDVVREQIEGYGWSPSSYRRRASPGAVSRMTETWGWINDHPVQSERQLLYAWAWQKTKKGKFLNDFAAREGIHSKTLRRAIIAICQRIADRLSQAGVACLEHGVDRMSEITPEHAPSKVASQRYATHEMVAGAKPKHDPNSPETKALIKRLEKANRKRARKTRAA